MCVVLSRHHHREHAIEEKIKQNWLENMKKEIMLTFQIGQSAVHITSWRSSFQTGVFENTTLIPAYLPHKVKMHVCISDNIQTTFYYHGRFLNILADDYSFAITRGSTSTISNMSIQPFTLRVDWNEIGCLMEVSIMSDVFAYCVIHLLHFGFFIKLDSGIGASILMG